MIVTMATFQETGEQLEEGMRHVREEVVPSIRGAKGVRAAYWMVDKGNGKRLSVTVWDDGDAAAAAMHTHVAGGYERTIEAIWPEGH